LVNKKKIKKKILLIQGGSSSEREISLRSGKACQKALRQLDFKVIVFDPFKDKLIKIKNFFFHLFFIDQ